MTLKVTRATRPVMMPDNEETAAYQCEVCGKEISKEDYEAYDGLCWECWGDQMTEESDFEEDAI